MQAVLLNSASKIRATFTGGDGEAAAPTSPLVTITRDSDGTAIETAAAATLVADGVVSFTLTAADIPTVDLLRASWTGTGASAAATEVDVVGGWLCSLEAISAAVVAAGGAVPSALALRVLREAAERKLEDACGVAFRPRYWRETLIGDGTDELLFSRPRPLSILTAGLEGVNVLADLSLVSGGIVTRDAALAQGVELDIAYAHGWPTCPEPITRAAIKLAASYVESGDDRISRFREDDQEIFLNLPGMGGETGIPEVDQTIKAYRYVVIG